MTMQLAVAVIHGMGSQSPGFSSELITELEDRIKDLGKDPSTVAWEEIYWQDITEPRQVDYLRRANQNNELDWSRLRRFVATALGDAAAYQLAGQSGTYMQIHRRIQERIKNLFEVQLEGRAVPLVVIAHSLGSHMMSNYIWDMQKKRGGDFGVWDGSLSTFERMQRLAGMITFGSNIPLFTFAFDKVEPIKFPARQLRDEVKRKARWLNFFDPDDVLGYPLKSINSSYSKTVDKDIAINTGGFLASWNPGSHSRYWTDNDFTRPVAAFLGTLL